MEFELRVNFIKNDQHSSKRFSAKLKETLEKSEKYKKGKKELLDTKQKTIDSLLGNMKETATKVRSDLIVKLSVRTTGDDPVFKLFQKLFTILYDKKIEEFNWDNFKEKALKFEKG
jgi:hypothetical protein